MTFYDEKQTQYQEVLAFVSAIKDILIKDLGNDMCGVGNDDGTPDDPTAMVFLDIPSFMSLGAAEKDLFSQAVSRSDAINFFITEDNWIRISFAILNTCERKPKNKVDTNVLSFQPKTS